MFPIQITIQNVSQLNAVMAALNLKEAAAEPLPKIEPPPAAAPAAASGQATAAAPAADAPAKTASAPAPAAASAAPAAQASTAATEALTYAKDVKPLILKIVSDKGRDAAAGALEKFGVTKGTDLKPEQFGEFVAHANTVLAGETALA